MFSLTDETASRHLPIATDLTSLIQWKRLTHHKLCGAWDGMVGARIPPTPLSQPPLHPDGHRRKPYTVRPPIGRPSIANTGGLPMEAALTALCKRFPYSGVTFRRASGG
jgi:hypothetical protein